jgi:hypothetical protein
LQEGGAFQDPVRYQRNILDFNPSYTSLRKSDSHIKQHNSLTFTIPCLHVGRYPSQPVSVLCPRTNDLPNGPTLTTFFCINTSTILKPGYYSSYLPAYEDGTERVFRNVGIQNSDAGELPRRKHTTSAKCLFKTTLNTQPDTTVFVLQGNMFRPRYRPSSGRKNSHWMAGAHAACSTSADVFSLLMGDV